MSATGRGAPGQSATADREIVISRVIDAPRELVFEAFTDVRHLSRWWGPEGFTTTTKSFEFRVRRGVGLRDARTGRERLPGVDHLDRDRPAGTDRVSPRRLAATIPNAFESVLTFEPDGAVTRIEMRTLFPSKKRATRRSRSPTRSRAGSRR